MEYHMPYGKRMIPITVSDSVQQSELNLPKQSTVQNPEELLISTFENPVHTASLREIIKAKPQCSIVIVVDDQTRKFPHNLILVPLLKYLENSGVLNEQVTILIATGVHQRPTPEQLHYLYGPQIIKNYSIHWNDQAEGNFIDLGTTSQGTPVLINKLYCDADVKILVTDVTLHYFAGYGGDRKSIFPGVASARSINKNHSLVMQSIYPGVLAPNPIHDDMTEAAQMIGADFVINVGLDVNGNILDIHSGALKFAFLKAVKRYKSSCIVPIQEKADLLILSAGGHPFDSNYQQSMKAIMQCQNAVKSGGKVLYFLKGENGIGIPAFKSYLDKFASSQKILEYIKTHEYQQGMHNAYYYRKFTENHEVYYKTELPEDYVKNTLGVNYVKDLELTISELTQNAKLVYIICHGTKMMVKLE
jgi:nickel-dependent lactate racemase